MTKYKTEWKGPVIIFSVLALAVFLVGAMEPRADHWVRDALLFDCLLVIVMLGTSIGSYALIDGDKLKSVFFFIHRTHINIDDIHKLRCDSTWKYQKLAKSLYVIGEVSGRKKILEFKDSMFSRQTLQKMVQDIRTLNTSILLDEQGRCLIDKPAV